MRRENTTDASGPPPPQVGSDSTCGGGVRLDFLQVGSDSTCGVEPQNPASLEFVACGTSCLAALVPGTCRDFPATP
jgi:hypothetical protein